MCTELVKERKDILRKKYKAIRKNVDNKIKVLNDNKIMQKLISLNEYKSSNLIFIYVSMPDEVDTKNIILKALSDKKIVAVPKCIKIDKKLEFFKINSLYDLKLGCFHIMEPITSCCELITDLSSGLCIVPGLSFDVHFNRLGYGGGFYDKFLSEFNGKTVGLCYEQCISDELLPKDNFDRKMNIVITEERIISSS